jgi:protein-S-isoprenylcysteine O-methyltransferase Ste14
MTKKPLLMYFLDQLLSLIAAAVAMFLSAGRLDWWPAWAVIAIWLAWFTATDFFLLRLNPSLMAERLSPPKGAKTWDRALLSIVRLLQLARYILAGLDQRFGWTGEFPPALQLAALMVCASSYALLAWAMASNLFFSQIVRIQTDRGHTVTNAGPYQYVRHPGYVGMIMFELALGVLLASWWALAAGLACAALFILRTALEDRTLQAELTGYADYAGRVRYRLLPGIW